MVVTLVTRDGKLLATWRTVFTPELRAREPAAVEEMLAAQHLEVLEHAGLGAFDPVLGTMATDAVPLTAPEVKEAPPREKPSAPTPPPAGKPAIYSHPAFDGLPMLEGQYGEGELELDLPAGEASVPATSPAPVLATVPSEELRAMERMTEVGVGEVGPVPPPPETPPARQKAPRAPELDAPPPRQRKSSSPSAVFNLGAQQPSASSRPKRPSLPAAPVVRLEDLSPDKKPR